MSRTSVDTPLMRQYLEIKNAHAKAILFFRLGDFYEMFFEDAVVASQALDLTLTTRDKNKADPVPMCGVPHHAAKGYIRRLIELGHKVAVCEQVEDPKLARGVVRREVTQVITPGVVVDDDQLEAKSNNFLAGLCVDGNGSVGLAAFDLSTSELRVTELEDDDALVDELVRLRPREVICAGLSEAKRDELAKSVGGSWEGAEIDLDLDAARVASIIAEKTDGELAHLDLRPAGPGLRAAALALRYADGTLPARGVPRARLICYSVSDHLQLDEATLRNLEIFSATGDGARKASLLGTLDATVTAMGGRLLRRMLSLPLLEVEAIRRRQDAVEFLFERPELRDELRAALRRIGDIERLSGRAVLELASPRELGRLGTSLAELPLIARSLKGASKSSLERAVPALLRWPDDLLEDLAARLGAALVDQPPPSTRDGGIFRNGYDAALDELVELAAGGRSAIAEMEADLRASTGISSLKVRYNRVFGYFIEVTRANLKHVPPEFQRKQTVANAERYVTERLSEYEQKVLVAQERRVALEQDLFERLRAETARHAPRLVSAAERIALLDVFCALAEVAQSHRYVRPEVDESGRIEIEQGRHPVVERYLPAGQFVPNDLVLDASEARQLIITGPNMAGKSTAIRQAALITVLAQLGSFVPCARARIGVVDRVFTRVGASDNLARGESTFMVEMRETAAILRGASARSLVVLDEIGRGTATYDGISIAWAVAEFLHDQVRARTLFATHYHELCRLSEVKEHARNYTVSAEEWQGRVVFLYALKPGSASRSYGIEVARLAGIPKPVLERARAVLSALEGLVELDDVPLGGRTHEPRGGQLSLLELPARHPAAAADHVVADLAADLARVDVNGLTPLEALNVLSELSARARAAGLA